MEMISIILRYLIRRSQIIEDNYDFEKGNHLPYYYLGNTDSQQQLSQDILVEAEQEVAKPYDQNLLESEHCQKLTYRRSQ